MFERFVMPVVEGTLRSMWHARWFVLIGVALSVAVSLAVEQGTVRRALRRAGVGGVVGATALGVLSPLCSCGQVPVVAGLLAAGVPWSTVMPFMITSPMTSPLTFGLIAGYLGVKFAAIHMACVAALGLVVGLLVLAGERSSLLADQSRLAPDAPAVPPEGQASRCGAASSGCTCGCGSGARAQEDLAGDGLVEAGRSRPWVRDAWDLVLQRSWAVIKILLVMGLIGGAVAQIVPSSRILAWFGSGNRYSVPLAATIGLPIQVNGMQALPLLAGLRPKGLSSGTALAFLMTGPGTCFQALAATWAVAKPRLFGFYVASILVGATVAGWFCNIVTGGGF